MNTSAQAIHAFIISDLYVWFVCIVRACVFARAQNLIFWFWFEEFIEIRPCLTAVCFCFLMFRITEERRVFCACLCGEILCQKGGVGFKMKYCFCFWVRRSCDCMSMTVFEWGQSQCVFIHCTIFMIRITRISISNFLHKHFTCSQALKWNLVSLDCTERTIWSEQDKMHTTHSILCTILCCTERTWCQKDNCQQNLLCLLLLVLVFHPWTFYVL